MSIKRTYEVELFSFDELENKAKYVARKDIKSDEKLGEDYRLHVNENTYLTLNNFQRWFLKSDSIQGIIVDETTGAAKISVANFIQSPLLRFVGVTSTGANVVFKNLKTQSEVMGEAAYDFQKQMNEKVCPQLKGKVSHKFALAAIKELDKTDKFRFRSNGHVFKETE